MHPIVIVGSGLAGYTVAREFRKLDRESPLVVLTRDAGSFYSKPSLSNALAAGKTAEALALNSAEQMAEQISAEVRAGVEVEAFDPVARTVTAGAATLPYRSLVLALGADPVRLPLGGDGAGAVMSVNDLADYAAFRARIAGAKHVAIIGAGLIGCEFANDLLAAGYRVSVLDPAPNPLSRLLPDEAAAALRDGLAAAGVAWQLGRGVTAVERSGSGLQLVLDDGAELRADVVLSAVGLRPRTALAGAAGLAVKRGIVADRFLETSAGEIYALGDCAEVEGLVLPYVMPIMQAARALAKTLAGQRTAVSYPAMPVVVKTPAHPVVVCPPLPGSDGAWQCTTQAGGVRALFHTPDGALAGFALTGAAVAEKNALAKGLPAWLGAEPVAA